MNRIISIIISFWIMTMCSSCSSSEDESKTTTLQKSQKELGREMAEQIKQPIFDAEAAKKLSEDRLKNMDEVTKQ